MATKPAEQLNRTLIRRPRSFLPVARWPKSEFSTAQTARLFRHANLSDTTYASYFREAREHLAAAGLTLGGIPSFWTSELFGRDFLVVWISDEWFAHTEGESTQAVTRVCNEGRLPIICSPRRHAELHQARPVLEHEAVHVAQILQGRSMALEDHRRPADVDRLWDSYWARLRMEVEASWLEFARWPHEVADRSDLVGGESLPRMALHIAQRDALGELLGAALEEARPSDWPRLRALMDALPGGAATEMGDIRLSVAVWRWANARWPTTVVDRLAELGRAGLPLASPGGGAVLEWLLTFPETRQSDSPFPDAYARRFGELPALGLPAAQRRWSSRP